MATYWENSCSFGLRYVSWYKYLIVSLFFSHLGFWSANLFLIAPFPDLCLLVPFYTILLIHVCCHVCCGLKFSSININSISGKKLGLLAFLDLHQPQIVAIQATIIDSTISTSELFPETCPYNVYRKDKTLDGNGVMLLIHKDIPHMPITESENGSESVWVKVFANKTSHFVASWYRPPDGKIEELELFKNQLEKVKTLQKGNNPPPSVHVLGDFNFRDIVWPDGLNKQGFSFSMSEGAQLVEIISDHELEQVVHSPPQEDKTHWI